ncbi:MAG TPA: CsgG/HfaB family protein [Elusimicrobiota bacterium]|nr:CsgG/HfaB family protein [Elusimicrobiota bacterium]
MQDDPDRKCTPKRHSAFFNRIARAIISAALLISSCYSGLYAEEPAGNSSISDKLDLLASQLTTAYRAKSGTKAPGPLAIFPLNSDSALSREHVGFAISELLTNRFVSQAKFTVVERTQLNRVLAEQKLQKSGAIDPASAAQAGKLLGARLLLLGSVEKLSGRYQVNVRIVDAQTDEVMAVAYQQFDSNLFEREAQPYLNLVPERQAIGLYLLYNYRSNQNSLSSYQSSVSGFPTSTITPQSFETHMIGGGVRYFFFPQWMADASLATLTKSATFTSGNEGGLPPAKQLQSGELIVFRGTVNWVRPFLDRFRSILGAGAALYRVNSLNTNADFGTTVAPTLKAGIEYKPQARVGLGIFANYDFISKKGSDSNPGQIGGNHDVLQFGAFSLEPTIAVYF